MVLFIRLSRIYQPKSNELFSVCYILLCFYHEPLSLAPFINIEALLAIISFCLGIQVFQIYRQFTEQEDIESLTIKPALRGMATYSPIAFVFMLVLFNKTNGALLLMSVSSAIAFSLIFLIERCLGYFNTHNKKI